MTIDLDMNRGTVSFWINGKDYGVAAQEHFYTRGQYYVSVNMENKGDKVTIISNGAETPFE